MYDGAKVVREQRLDGKPDTPRMRVVGLALTLAGFALLAAVMLLTAAQTAPCVPLACISDDSPFAPFVARLPWSQPLQFNDTERQILVITSVLAVILLIATLSWLGRLSRAVYVLTLLWGAGLLWLAFDKISSAKALPRWCFEPRAPCANWFPRNTVPFHFVPEWPWFVSVGGAALVVVGAAILLFSRQRHSVRVAPIPARSTDSPYVQARSSPRGTR